MATPEERLLEWLRDAHAMEEQAEHMLTGMLERIENYPELTARIEKHIAETRNQAELVKSCIQRRGAEPSVIKDMAGKLTAFGQSVSGLFTGDEIVKGCMACYTFEHMEVAAYKTLVAAANAVGDEETADICKAILAEEEEMARWLEQHFDMTVKKYLRLEMEPGATAKH